MSKALLISIRPEWVAKILNGEKTLEIRKTAPKCDLPIDVFIYCTKNKLHYSVGALMFNRDDCFKRSVDGTYKYGDSVELMGYSPDYPYDKNNFLNGKVVAKFTLREIFQFPKIEMSNGSTAIEGPIRIISKIVKKACLSGEELLAYCKIGDNYAWLISDLVIFDQPKKLSEFGLKRAPQSWQYVEVEE